MYKVIGIDEAGRGPVLGSLFIGFAIISLEGGYKDLRAYQETLKNLGVKDSKQLTSKKRNELYAKLKTQMDITYAQLTPANIDMNKAQGKSLNELEIQAIVTILTKEQPQLLIIDALTANPQRFKKKLKQALQIDCKIIAENKADTNYEIVAAASIIAKELREQELEQIKQQIRIDCGSGYPSDPQTQRFLKKHKHTKAFECIFRKSWKTYQNTPAKVK